MGHGFLTMPQFASPINYRLGSLYALFTALLYSFQEPFSFPAAKHFTTLQFVCLTQIALLLSIPLLMLRRPNSGRDFLALFRDGSNYGKLAVIFAVGMTGLLLYNFGLSDAHPIIISAILNLLPFWAALVALILMRVPIPVSPAGFFGCFAGAFIGAMVVAWSQLDASSKAAGELVESFLHGSWVYALPVPLCSALGGTLVGKWFAKYDESAAVAAQFFVANVVLIPATLVLLYERGELRFHSEFAAIILMIVGTIIAASVGRVFYQIGLTVTGGDNGFVSMFLNLVPALTALVSLVMSPWITDLHFAADPLFFVGLALIAASLFLFSWASWRQPARPA